MHAGTKGIAAAVLGGVAVLVAAPVRAAVQHHYFTITVVDKTTSAPIAGIKMATTNEIVFVSDTAGKVRFYEPGVMGTSVWFALGSCNSGTCAHASGGATTCTTHADCNLGYSPPTGFLGIVGAGFTANEQGNVTIRMCPSGGTCTPDTVVGSNAAAPAPLSTQMYALKIVDQASGRGVPQMTVQTSTQTYVTDSGGMVAYYDAPRMGTSVHFTVTGDGYNGGAADLVTTAGASGQISVTRTDLAERLYRVTGGGVYHDTVLLEQTPPTANPVLNAQVFGQDTAQSTVYQGKVFWIWGDTGRPSFPLGNFRATGATSLLPASGGLDPSVGVDLTYYGDGAGFVAGMCPATNFPSPPGYGNLLCWMFDLLSAPNAGGTERLFARYTLISGGSGLAETGLGRFNDTTKVFDKFLTWDPALRAIPLGSPTKIVHGATTYAYYVAKGTSSFGTGLKQTDNLVRVVATESALGTPSGYEAYTALVQGSDTTLDTNPDGTLHYAWKTNTKTLSGDNSVADAAAPADQKLYGKVQDPDSGAAPLLGGISQDWNAYRQRWVGIVEQTFGSPSFLGEYWLGEADTPMGPWVYARKIVSHQDGYTFYNPRHHAFFNKQNGREIYFEGTYTTFATALTPTPRDNYNQVMHRLDLDTAGVVLPVPVYDLSAATVPGTFVTKSGLRTTTTDSTPVFLVPDRTGYSGTVPLYWSNAACLPRQLVVGGTPTTPAVFYALPGNAGSPPASTVPLYDYANAGTGAHAYSTNGSLSLSGFTRATDPIARVWSDPIRVALPVSQYLAPLVADAGVDQCTLEHAPGIGANVVLDGTHTTAPSGTTVTYAWSFPGGTATGASPTVTIHAGLNVVTLTTTTNTGLSSTDTVLVNVAACASGCC